MKNAKSKSNKDRQPKILDAYPHSITFTYLKRHGEHVVEYPVLIQGDYTTGDECLSIDQTKYLDERLKDIKIPYILPTGIEQGLAARSKAMTELISQIDKIIGVGHE